jgi:hypothetical protein
MLIKLGAEQYKVEYDYNSMCEIEEIIGFSVYVIALNDSRLGLGAVRAFLKAGLSLHHPEISLTETGNLIQTYIKQNRTAEPLVKQLMTAMKQSGLMMENNKVAPPGGGGSYEKKSHPGQRK